MNQTVLQHHGILGQQWGVRRFQNPDGSLTPRGQAHLDKKDEKWASTKGEKVKKKVQRLVDKDMNEFVRTQLDLAYTSRGKLSSSTIEVPQLSDFSWRNKAIWEQSISQ